MHPHIHLCMRTCTCIGMMRWGYGQMPSWGATVLLSLKLGRKPSQTWRYHTPVSQAWCGLSEELGGVYLAVHFAVVQMRTGDPKRLVPKPQRLQDVPLVVPSSLGKNVRPRAEFCLPNPRCSQLPADGAGYSPVWETCPQNQSDWRMPWWIRVSTTNTLP